MRAALAQSAFLLVALFVTACERDVYRMARDTGSELPGDGDGDADMDSDTDSDSDADTDADTGDPPYDTDCILVKEITSAMSGGALIPSKGHAPPACYFFSRPDTCLLAASDIGEGMRFIDFASPMSEGVWLDGEYWSNSTGYVFWILGTALRDAVSHPVIVRYDMPIQSMQDRVSVDDVVFAEDLMGSAPVAVACRRRQAACEALVVAMCDAEECFLAGATLSDSPATMTRLPESEFPSAFGLREMTVEEQDVRLVGNGEMVFHMLLQTWSIAVAVEDGVFLNGEKVLAGPDGRLYLLEDGIRRSIDTGTTADLTDAVEGAAVSEEGSLLLESGSVYTEHRLTADPLQHVLGPSGDTDSWLLWYVVSRDAQRILYYPVSDQVFYGPVYTSPIISTGAQYCMDVTIPFFLSETYFMIGI